MLDVIQSSRINTDASEEDLKPGEYRDALNISMIANQLGGFSKGTTYGNIDTNIVFKGLNPDAVCLGTAIDTAGTRVIITFYQRIPFPFSTEYQSVINYALSRGFRVPSPQVQTAQNFLIEILKRDGIWNGLDVFYCFYGDGDENFAKINWKTPNDATTAINNGMTYSENLGFKGDGLADYLDTTWIPSLSIKYLQDNASLSIGVEEVFTSANGNGAVGGGGAIATVYPYTAVNTIRAGVNGAEENFVDAEFTATEGLIIASRSAAAVTAVRKNTSDPVPGTAVSAGRPAVSFYIGAVNNNGGGAISFNADRYSLFAAGEYLNTFDRETKFYKNWQLYKNSFITPLVAETHIQEVLMYLLVDQVAGIVSPLVKSSRLLVTEKSYLDGYSFVNELFFFNFRESAPKVINIQRALDSPGFYDELSETSLTIIKPHPPYSPVAVRALGSLVNAPIQKKPFQFMAIYRFVDGEQSTKSPASEYLNSLDDRDALTSLYDRINITIDFPQKDYSIVEGVELYVRNNNAIADWRTVTIIPRTEFIQAGDNYRKVYVFQDNVVGNFLPLELGTKINDAIPQRSNYLAFIENRVFMIDSLLDYDFTSTFQIKIDLDVNAPTPDDRLPVGATPLYAVAEFEYDSEYTVGMAFYDRYGRKYPSSLNDEKLVTPPFVPVVLPALDDVPDQTTYPQLRKPKITAKYDLRAAGNIANYGKPPSFAFWWGMIRSKNTKWEFQQSIQCLLRFPYQLTKWPDTDPAKFPDPNLFLEDGYLYWHPEKLLYGASGGGLDITRDMINDYIDVVIPPNFPYPLDATILIDFMMEVCTDVNATKIKIENREVVEIFANKIRIRGDRAARWFSNLGSGLGQYKAFPKFTTGVNLTGVAPLGVVLTKDETTFPLIIKRRRQNNLESIILYDTPQVYPVFNPGTRFCAFQGTQTATIERAEYPPLYVAPPLARTLNQGDILIQPILITPTTVAFNHAIKITWGPNTGDSLRLKVKVSLWQLNDQNQPILELYSATGDAGGAYSVRDGETVEYLINADAELTTGWYGYGIQILEVADSNVQFENPEFDLELAGWLQSPEGIAGLTWAWASTDGNFAYVNVSAMGLGWSKTLYQFLNQVQKDELTIEVVVEGFGMRGPLVNGPINQYPSNTQTPIAINASESFIDLGRNVTPYFIDCSTPVRLVNLNTLNYTLQTAAPIGSLIRAEIWRIDQVTKEPISMIAGSEGAWTAVPGAPGAYSVPFGTNKTIDTTGWYGIALAFDYPVFSDFTDKSYVNNGVGWIVTAGSPTWSFQGDTALPPVYETVEFATVLGADLGYLPMNTPYELGNPVFFPTGTDPAGYDNHQIVIDWGDNVKNGWHGKTITVAIWEVDQVTKKPTTYAPLMSGTTDVRSNGLQTHFISNAQKLLGNKWYQFGLRTPTGWTGTVNQFVNSSFKDGLTSWSTTAGIAGATWTSPIAGLIRCSATLSSGNFDTGYINQNIAGYVQVCLPIVALAAGNIITCFADITLNGVVQQTINVGVIPANGITVNFNAFVTAGIQGVGIRFYGTSSSAPLIEVHAINNSFNQNLLSTPMLRKAAVSNADYEAWLDWNSPLLPIDSAWKNGYKHWLISTHGRTDPAARMIISEGNPVDNAPLIFVQGLPVTSTNNVDDPEMINGAAGWSAFGGGNGWTFLDPGWQSTFSDTAATRTLGSSNIVNLISGVTKLQVSLTLKSITGVGTRTLQVSGFADVVVANVGSPQTVILTANTTSSIAIQIKFVHSGGTGSAQVTVSEVNVLNENTSEILYGLVNMNDAPLTATLVNANGAEVGYGVGKLQAWVFNDPNTFTTTGVKVLEHDLVNSNPSGGNWSITNLPVNLPAGFKYLGYRWVASGPKTLRVFTLTFAPQTAFNTWYKDGNTLAIKANERQFVAPGGISLANFHADNIAAGGTTARLGQNSLTGILVRANIEIFDGLISNDYDLILSDSSGFELGRTSVVGQAKFVNPQISITAVNAPTTTGLYLSVKNNNASGILSVRIRQITNVNTPVLVGANNSIANAKTWQIDSTSNAVQLGTTTATSIDGTDDIPQPPLDVTIVLADGAGVEISAQQVFTPNTGQVTLIFSPTLQAAGNYNYGLKVKNNPLNSQVLGTIRIHSVLNVASNDGEANIIANTIDPGNPLYEAWNQFSLGSFVRAGYVSNFIAVVDDLIMSAFTPIQINPTSYHLVANIVPAGVSGHSGNYGQPPNSTYNYGIVYPSASSDPDAAGIVYEQKTGQSIGDINIKIIDLREKSQSNIVRWSDPIIAGTRNNNSNAFSDGNKYSVDFQRGAIQVMIAMHDHTLFAVHTMGMTSLYVQRAFVSSPSEVQAENDQLYLTNRVIGNDNKLTSNLGTVNPESVMVVESGTIAYGFDLVRKSFWTKTNNGVRNLTYECNAKKFFNQVCHYRLLAHNEGEDVKIFVGYNEKQKSFYLTFAPFIYRGQAYPAVTIAYNAYIDGFLSRYSFEPISYLATEDVIHTVKAREMVNPDFFGDFSFWKTNDSSTGTADWFKSLTAPPGAKANTTVPGGTRILNPDFVQGATFWSTYGAGSTWTFLNDGAETTILGGTSSRDLVNASGAPATYLVRLQANQPTGGFEFDINVYDGLGVVLETLAAGVVMTGDDIVEVTQTVAGRIGVIVHNVGATNILHLNLFTTVKKTYLLYQPMPVAKEDLRVRLIIPVRLGSIKVLVYSFNDPESPFLELLNETSLIRNKDLYSMTVNVPNTVTAKYIGLYAITDYDTTVISYFNVNSVISIWRHDQAGRTNNFFGVQYDSAIELVFKVQAGQVRIFNSLGIMSESAWSVESFVTSEGNISALDTENFRLRDGIYSATIMRDMLTPQAALPDPVNNKPITHGFQLIGDWIKIILRNSETLRQIELKAVYLGSDELAGNLLGKK